MNQVEEDVVAVLPAGTNQSAQSARPIPAQSTGPSRATARPAGTGGRPDLDLAGGAVRGTRVPGADTTRPPGRHRPVSAARILTPVACDHRRAPVPLSMVLALAAAVCLAVIGLAALANAGPGAATVPDGTAVVRVEPGDSLLDLAERMAPNSDPAAVVDRIRELNGLTGSQLRPGQPLTVPAER